MCVLCVIGCVCVVRITSNIYNKYIQRIYTIESERVALKIGENGIVQKERKREVSEINGRLLHYSPLSDEVRRSDKWTCSCLPWWSCLPW